MLILGRCSGRFLLVLLTIWALAMVVPDLFRLAEPLGSFGLSVNNDGLVTDVQGPFSTPLDSPAWQAGLRSGDRLDLARMRCVPVNTLRCASGLAVLGGLQLVSYDRHGEFVIAAGAEKPVRHFEIVAAAVPATWTVLAVLALDQFAAIVVILAAAWLVWTRPGGMTWGFFLYVIWFNPGQSFEYYALVQRQPAALLAQNVLACIAHAAGFAGFLLFALRVPEDFNLPQWRKIERALPAVAVFLAVLLGLSYLNVFGYRTEMVTRIGLLCGLLIDGGALAILLRRRKELPPSEYQRLRWIIWGCLIGLPALILADIGQGTSLANGIWPDGPPPQQVWGLIRLINGVLCLLVFEAVRRPQVVSIAIPLRRVTILGLLLTIPTLFLHEEINHLGEAVRTSLAVPGWAWLAIAAILVFILSRLHEWAVHLTDRYFNRSVARAGRDLSTAILRAPDLKTIEDRLVRGACAALSMTSATLFRQDGSVFRRGDCAVGWEPHWARTLDTSDVLLQGARPKGAVDIDAEAAERNHLPEGPKRPVLAVPVANHFRCHAIALYGAHVSGNALNHDERAMLIKLADVAAVTMEQIDRKSLLRRVTQLERELAAATARSAS
jgi:hypothetical protein